MEAIKKIQKLIMIVLFMVLVVMFTRVDAFTVTSSSNIVDHNFTPYKADGKWTFYCIHRGSPYKANLPAGYSANQTYGEWCVTCDKEPAKPTLPGGADWGTSNVKTMEYTSIGAVDDKSYQDAAYVMASAYESGKIEDMTTQWSLWETMLNLGHKNTEKGQWGEEAVAYRRFYESIHDGTTDVYSSQVSDTTDVSKIKVEVSQSAKTYIIGPFKVDYPVGEYGNTKWSYITDISLLNQANTTLGSVGNNKVTLLNKNGVVTSSFPKQNEDFYVKFSSTLGDIYNAKLKVDFKYLESCSATLEKYEGTINNWVWEAVDTGKECTKEHKEGEDTTIKTWKLQVEKGGKPQELVAFKRPESVHGGTPYANKNYKTTSLIVAPGGVDLTMKLSGQVFLDLDQGKINTGNNIMDGNNEALNGVEVVLYEVGSNKVVARTNSVQQYHVHTASCYSSIGHIHTGNATTGGGCYTNKVHDHVGSWEAGGPGTCYTTPVKHVHTGTPKPTINTTSKPHHHTGSATTGGGCYTEPIYHKCTSACPSSHVHTDPNGEHWTDCWEPYGSELIGEGQEVECGKCGATYRMQLRKCSNPNCTKFGNDGRVGVWEVDAGHGDCWSYQNENDGCKKIRDDHPVTECSKKGTIEGYKKTCPYNEGDSESSYTVSGNGCYTKPIYHTHDSSCYSSGSANTHIHGIDCYIIENGSFRSNDICTEHCGLCDSDFKYVKAKCNSCIFATDFVVSGCKCGYYKFGSKYQDNEGIGCEHTRVKMNCTKTETVGPTCGMQEGQIDHYELGCGRDEGAMCWELSCTKPLYVVNCTNKPSQKLTCTKSNTPEKTVSYTLKNPVVTQTNGDKKGYYEFAGLDSMKKYYVKFVYNGIMYTNVLYNSNNADNVSKADETSRYNYREPLNQQFAEIGSYPSSYQIKTKVFNNDLGDYNKTYLQEDIVDIFKLISLKMVGKNTDNYIQACREAYDAIRKETKYSSISNEELKRMIQFAADCRVPSYTVRNYPLIDNFIIDTSAKTINGTTYLPIYAGAYNQLHINLGIKARPTFDMALYKDVLKAEVEINGKKETYNYDSRKQSTTFSFGISEKDYLNGLRGAYKDSYPYVNSQQTRGVETDSYDIDLRTEEIANGQSSNYGSTGQVNRNYQVNNNYDLANADRLKVYITYKIAIRNQSSVIGAVTEVVDYFDPNYKFVDAYVGNSSGNKTGDVTKYDTSKYQANTQYKSNKGAYTTVYLRPNAETRLSNGEEQYIYVKLQLLGPSNDAGTLLSKELLNNKTLNTMNLAEINGYKTYNAKTGTGTPGLIDIDSKPGNLNISNIAALTQTNLVNYPNIRQMYEDDTSRAPAMIFKILESRTIEGEAFEDSTGKGENVYTNQTRAGDGILDGKDTTRIGGVQVELVEIKNGTQKVRATTTTNASGWYGFTGFLPGDYQVKFTYGKDHKTAMTTSSNPKIKGLNAKSYNGQDYESTKYQTVNTQYWYTDSNKWSDAKDTDESINRVINYSRNGNSVAIRNHKAEVFNSYIWPAKPYTSGNNEELAKELEENTYREAYTKTLEIEVEYAKQSVTGNQAKNNYKHQIKNVDFGIVERPKSKLTLDQDVSKIKVTLADGTVLFDTEKEVNNVQWIANGKLLEYDKGEQLNIIMDDELLNGAKLEITYDFVIKNEGEAGSTTRAVNIINYVSNNLTFDQSKNPKWEVVRKADVQNDSKTTMINNQLVDLSAQSVILKTKSDNNLTSATTPGQQVTAQLVLEKVLSAESSSDDLRYTNLAEIVEIDNTIGRYDHGAIPGNQALTVVPQEYDAAGASRNVGQTNGQDGIVIITPPTGSTYIYYTIGIVGALVLIGGIVLIKKFVLDAKK